MMMNLKQYRGKNPGFSDLIDYAALVSDGVVLNKDGSLLGGFYYRGDDASVSTNVERNYITSLVNKYLAQFGAGWAMWADAVRIASPHYPAPSESFFPEQITALIDAERREQFEGQNKHFETEYTLIFSYLPPTKGQARLSDLMYDDDQQKEKNFSRSLGQRHIDEFNHRLLDLESGLGDLLKLNRMSGFSARTDEGETYKSDQLINYLHYSISGEMAALRIPDAPMYLDSWLGSIELWTGNTPKRNDEFISCISIEGLPATARPGILNKLDSLPLSYKWSSRFIFLEQAEALSELNKYRRKWTQRVRGFWSQVFKTQNGTINMDAVEMVSQTDTAISEAKSGLVSYGYYTSVVVLTSKDRSLLDDQARYIRREIERVGFSARVETINTTEAWLGTLAGHPYPNVRRPVLHTLNLADLLPLSSVWPGLRECPCEFYPQGAPALMHTITNGATPYRLNLHVGDVGHTLVFGPTGAGKSTFLAMILAQARRYRSVPQEDGSCHPMTITAFDKGRSLYALCSATRGKHYDIASDDDRKAGGALAPLREIDSASDLLWAHEWLTTCYQLQSGAPATVDQKEKIFNALNLLKETPKNKRSIFECLLLIQDADLRAGLKHYTIDGPMGHLLDGEQDALTLSSFTVFEIDELMKLGDVNAIPVLLYLFRRFEKCLSGQPAILSLDEAWVMLGHPVFREKIREWLKELRKKNCIVVLATQSLSDAVRSGILDLLIEQCPTKIMLPNKEATLQGTSSEPGPADLYAMFGMNTREIETIKTMQPKKHYYYKSPLGRRVFELGLGPIALSFVAVSDKESIANIMRLEKEHGCDWPEKWLEKRGVNYDQYISV